MRFARWVVIVLLLVATVGAALEWGERERLRYLRKPMHRRADFQANPTFRHRLHKFVSPGVSRDARR